MSHIDMDMWIFIYPPTQRHNDTTTDLNITKMFVIHLYVVLLPILSFSKQMVCILLLLKMVFRISSRFLDIYGHNS